MPWTVVFDEETQVVDSRYEGVLTGDELRASIHAAIATGARHQTNLHLADCSRMEVAHSFLDLYGLADMLAETGFTTSVKDAMVLPQLEASAEYVEFWETACRNHGMNIRIFRDRESALAWLCTPPATPPP